MVLEECGKVELKVEAGKKACKLRKAGTEKKKCFEGEYSDWGRH